MAISSGRLSARAGDEFVLVDVSDYQHFDPAVVLEQVVEVIDHHPGFENYWAQKLGSAADILPIGAAATLIFSVGSRQSCCR